MNNNLGHSALTTKSINEKMIPQNISRSIRADQKYLQKKDQKISMQLQLMRLHQQYRRQLSMCQQQLNQLKVQVDRQQQMLRDSQNRQLQQKQQVNTLHKQNLKLYQQNQKNKKMINSLKSDNQALQLQIQRWKGDRKTYSTKLDSIYELKKNMNAQISHKNNLIDEQQSKIRELQKKLIQFKLKTQQLSGNIAQKQRQNKEISAEVRNHLQGYLETQNLAGKLQHQLQQSNQVNVALKERVKQSERQKQILLQRIYELGGNGTDRSDEKEQYQQNQNYRPTKRQSQNPSNFGSPQLQNIISPTDQRLMLEIQSFMRQFESLLDRKSQQRQTTQLNNEKVVNAVERLERNM